MTGADLLVLAPWIIFGAGLAAICHRLLSLRSASHRRHSASWPECSGEPGPGAFSSGQRPSDRETARR